MYTLTYFHRGESHTVEFQGNKRTPTILSQAREYIADMTSGDPDIPFELRDSQGFLIATEEDFD